MPEHENNLNHFVDKHQQNPLCSNQHWSKLVTSQNTRNTSTAKTEAMFTWKSDIQTLAYNQHLRWTSTNNEDQTGMHWMNCGMHNQPKADVIPNVSAK